MWSIFWQLDFQKHRFVNFFFPSENKELKVNFKEDGSFDGIVNLTVVDKASDINEVRISARTSAGWGPASDHGVINSVYNQKQKSKFLTLSS